MAGKTPKDVREDAADVGAVDTEDAPAAKAETSANAGKAGKTGTVGERPAPRRRRRVRVIEVLDDEDLDEVLDAIDAEDAATEQIDEDEAGHEPVARPKPKTRPKTASKAVSKPGPAPRAEVDDDEDDEDEDERSGSASAATKVARRRTPVSLDEVAPPTFLGLRPVQAVVIALVVAVPASLAIWQWRTASGLSADRDARAEVSKAASAYGDIALNYNAANYRTQMKKAEALMGGDLLESFRTTTLPNLGTTFRQNPRLELTSKTDQVFVGSVDERFATVTISVDVTVKTSDGVHQAPATLIRLAMAKIDGRWKVTKMYASGVNDQTQQQNSGLPSVPTSPSPGSSPKNEKAKD